MTQPDDTGTDEPTEHQGDELIEKREIVETESSSEWVFNWDGSFGQYELSYVNARGVWLRRAQYNDPDGTAGGWNEPQEVDLEQPKTYEDAQRIAASFIRRR